MDCCNRPSRRQALLWTGLAASAAAITSATSASASTSDILVTDVEVATVTDTSVIVTWFTGSSTAVDAYGFPAPVATDTEVQLAPFDVTTLTAGTYQTVYSDSTPTAYHYAEVTGLTPGTPYAYQALSSGQVAVRTSMQFPVGVGGSLDYANVFETLQKGRRQ